VQNNEVAIDFMSTHEYPTGLEHLLPSLSSYLLTTCKTSSLDVGNKVSRDTMREVISKAVQEANPYPLFYTEYNDGLYDPSLHDEVRIDVQFFFFAVVHTIHFALFTDFRQCFSVQEHPRCNELYSCLQFLDIQ
jgi:hypothetical protein